MRHLNLRVRGSEGNGRAQRWPWSCVAEGGETARARLWRRRRRQFWEVKVMDKSATWSPK